MPGLDPGIHPLRKRLFESGWIAGSSPAMTAAVRRSERAERALGDQADEALLGDFAPRRLRLRVVARIFHHEHRLAFGGEHLQVAHGIANILVAVSLAFAVLAVEQVLAGEAVDGAAELGVDEQRVAVLRDHQEIGPLRLGPCRDPRHELDHLVAMTHGLVLVDLVEIDAVKAGGQDAVGVGEYDLLPGRIPEAHAVVPAPLAILGAEPGRRALRPVPAVVLGLADAHVGEDDAPRTVRLLLHALDLGLRQRRVVGAVSITTRSLEELAIWPGLMFWS